MENIIIIAIIAVIMLLAIRETIKHFSGKGGCCGGSDYKPKKKRLSKVICKKVFTVDGMHCEHCKRRVEEVVNDIKGVAGIVNLKKGELTVSYGFEVDDNEIIEKLTKRGYTVVNVRKIQK